ncbi:hypothetical protein GPECTOR_35g852 [Gonium pectorale]|uniref:Uncharacterized protein n=1 Tax=Gonium pectorale TaxID=33097 RepID=A0A150GC54_GONPE|nr:hypothetical protein GPECTOR_35g852 [Gonium pectorale]|eukprot:KXZ47414.1 hypothetical protein GPECTOR_35g852 [Gonium pectorale]
MIIILKFTLWIVDIDFVKAARAALAPLSPPFVAARLQVVLRCSGEAARPELQACLRALVAEAEAASATEAGASPKARHRLLQDALLVLLQRCDQFAYGAGEEEGYGSEKDAETRLLRWSMEEKARAGYRPRSRPAHGGKAAAADDSQSSSVPPVVQGAGQTELAAAAAAATAAPLQPPTPQQLGTAALSRSLAAAGNDMVVVTLLLATSGRRVLPRRGKGGGGVRGLASAEEVREALLELSGFLEEEVLRAEVVWAPQAPGESLSWRQLQLSYQNLLPL